LASARMDQGPEHYQDADDALHEALRLAQDSQQHRVEAMANLMLASLRNQEHRFDEVIAPAQKALDYYRQNGYFEPAAKAWLLMIRTLRNKGRLQEALEQGQSFLAMATQSRIPELEMEAEEVIGTIYVHMENYPEALNHFESAKNAAGTAGQRAYQSLHCADVLWKIGRYDETETLLSSISDSEALAPGIAEIRVASLVSREKYAQALDTSNLIMANYPLMASDRHLLFERYRAIAEAHLGLKSKATVHLQELLVSRDKMSDSGKADLNLAAAEIYLTILDRGKALDSASSSETYFASHGQPDSDLQSSCFAANASKGIGNYNSYLTYAAKVVDISSKLQQKWPPQAYEAYISRPDIHAQTLQCAPPPPRKQ
jgi:tetratricopeptide (TPR) repeat protein